jgi:hypothetical protein
MVDAFSNSQLMLIYLASKEKGSRALVWRGKKQNRLGLFKTYLNRNVLNSFSCN